MARPAQSKAEQCQRRAGRVCSKPGGKAGLEQVQERVRRCWNRARAYHGKSAGSCSTSDMSRVEAELESWKCQGRARTA